MVCKKNFVFVIKMSNHVIIFLLTVIFNNLCFFVFTLKIKIHAYDIGFGMKLRSEHFV